MVDDCLLQSLIQERISQYFSNYGSREKKAAAGESNSSSSDTSDTNSRKSCKRKRPIEEQVEDSKYQLSFVDSLIAKKCMWPISRSFFLIVKIIWCIIFFSIQDAERKSAESQWLKLKSMPSVGATPQVTCLFRESCSVRRKWINEMSADTRISTVAKEFPHLLHPVLVSCYYSQKNIFMEKLFYWASCFIVYFCY